MDDVHTKLAKATGLPIAKVEELREIFNLVDIDRGNSISPDELMQVCIVNLRAPTKTMLCNQLPKSLRPSRA